MQARPLILTLTVLIAGTAAPALADSHGRGSEPADPAFRKLDADHDGLITRAEAKAAGKDFGRPFEQADGNRDGRLDEGKFVKAQSIYQRAQAEQYLKDSVIAAKVKTALLRDPEVKALEITVETYEGIVLLSGFVDNEKQARRAAEIASGVPGVKAVKNSLVVKGKS